MQVPQLLGWLSDRHDSMDRTTSALAREAGLGRQKVDRWLKGKVQTIKINELIELCNAFDLSLRELVLHSEADIHSEVMHAVLGAKLPFKPDNLSTSQKRFVLRRTACPFQSTLYIPEDARSQARQLFEGDRKLALIQPGHSCPAAVVAFERIEPSMVIRANWNLLNVPGAKNRARFVSLTPFLVYVSARGGLTGEEYRALFEDHGRSLARYSIPADQSEPVWSSVFS